jgi:hypothetical protein
LADAVFEIGFEKVAFAPEGWLTTVQSPEPVAGLLAAKVAVPVVTQIFWVGPALEVVGVAFLVTVTSLVELVQVPFETVQRKV